MKVIKSKIGSIKFMALALSVVFSLFLVVGANVASSNSKSSVCLQPSSGISSTTKRCSSDERATLTYGQCGNVVGSAGNVVVTSISFGCRFDHCVSSTGAADGSTDQQGCGIAASALIDMIFAIIRFLSDGVGIVVVGSIVVGGIQYIGSRGEPNATAQAINRIRGALIALLIFIFSYAILNYVIPVGFFKS